MVIYGLEESRWNDIDRGKLLICPSELSGKSTSSNLVASQEELGEGMMNLAFEKYLCSYIIVNFYMPQNLTTGADGFTSLRRKA
jgi:hypothetical protein